jgi:hypothetical protein
MSETSKLIGYAGRTIGREELALVPTPPATATHQPVPHHEIVQALVETLGFRHIGVVHDEYAVSPDGMKMFGVLDLETEMHGARFSIGLRNSHDKSMRLALTCGYRVFVCSNMAFSGDFTPVLAKHSKSFSLVDSISIGVDRMPRNFEPMRKQIEAWRECELTDVAAKLIIYEAFIESELEVPNISSSAFTTTISSHSMKNFSLAQCGACQTRSLRPSKNSTPFHNLSRRPSLVDFSTHDSRASSEDRLWGMTRVCGPPNPNHILMTHCSLGTGKPRRLGISGGKIGQYMGFCHALRLFAADY